MSARSKNTLMRAFKLKVLRVEQDGESVGFSALNDAHARTVNGSRLAVNEIHQLLTSHLAQGRRRLPNKEERASIKKFEAQIREFRNAYQEKHGLKKRGKNGFDFYNALDTWMSDPSNPRPPDLGNEVFRTTNVYGRDAEEMTPGILSGVFYKQLFDSGLVSTVAAESANSFSGKLFSTSVLYDLIGGRRSFPMFERPHIVVPSKGFSLETRSHTNDQGKTYKNPVVTVPRLVKGEGRGVKWDLVCYEPRRDKGDLRAVIEGIASGKYSKSAIELQRRRRPGRGEEWFISIPYSEDVAQQERSGYAAIHRGIANFATILYMDGHKEKKTYVPGGGVLRTKFQFRNRRARLANDLRSSPKHHVRPRRSAGYRSLAHKEETAIARHIHWTANYIGDYLQQHPPEMVFLDDFSMQGADVAYSDRSRQAQPFVRTFPFFKLKQTIIHELKKRGIPVTELPSHYISVTCPCCGNRDQDNVRCRPSSKSQNFTALQTASTAENHNLSGQFDCTSCGYTGSLDKIAAGNLLVNGLTELGDKKALASIKDTMERYRDLVTGGKE